MLDFALGFSNDFYYIGVSDKQFIICFCKKEVLNSSAVPLTETGEIVSGAIYCLKNAASGKYLNVHNGRDAVGTNIYQWTKDNSKEQNFRVVYSSTYDAYILYPMCSSNGTNRIVSVDRKDAALSNGQNVHLSDQRDISSQYFKIIYLGLNQFRIQALNSELYISTDDNYNGSSNGRYDYSNGNVYLSSYVASVYQHWFFEIKQTEANASPSGSLDEVSATAIHGWAWRNDIPETSIQTHIYVKNNSTGEQTGYTTIANRLRSDLQAYGFGNGYHGFCVDLDWMRFKPGQYTINAYGIGADGDNPSIGGSPKNFTVREIEANIDSISDNAISGWAWKPDSPNNPVEVHIYITRMNGEVIWSVPLTANEYRGDLFVAGKGDGNHSFTVDINWKTFPEELLKVVIYGVDGSGVSLIIYNNTYENRKKISLVGMTDSNGHDFSSWITSAVRDYCNLIGCSQMKKYIGANKGGLLELIRDSSYCTISTHGSPSGIEWCLHPGEESVQRGYLYTDDLELLPNNYFDTTRCVVFDACLTGYGGIGNSDNLVNTLHRKGVKTVLGFTKETLFYYYTDTGKVIPDQGNKLWMREFTHFLSAGCSVQQAADAALNSVLNVHSNDCGLSEPCIAGEANQIIKH